MSIHTSLKQYNSDSGLQKTGNYTVLATVADLFARLFIAPPEHTLINACRSAEAIQFFIEIGEELERQDLSRRLINTLTGEPADRVEHTLGYQYVTLFDGITGPDSTPPYESFFTNETGRLWQQPYTEMRKIMSALDVSAGRWNEPDDHLAIQLAAFAEALRQKNRKYVKQLHERLTRWIPLLGAAIQRIAPVSFYSDLISLLIAFLSFSVSLHIREIDYQTLGEYHVSR